MPILSIIIPAYNVEKYIETCLNSIVNQSADDVEIIVVDDGSTDSTGQICEEYKKNYSNIKVYHTANSGPSEARNYGIRKAEGVYIAFLDADDFYVKDAIKSILCHIEDHAVVDVIIGRYIYYFLPKGLYKECSYHLDKNLVETSIKEALFWELFRDKTYEWYTCLNIVRREYILKNSLFFKKGVYFEDALWSPELLFRAEKLSYIDKPFYVYLQNRKGATTVAVNEKVYGDKLRVCQHAKEFCEKYEISEPLAKKFMGNCNSVYVSLLADSWKFEKDKRKGYWQEIREDKEILLYSGRQYQKYLYRLWKIIGIRGVSYILHLRAEWVRKKQNI